MTRDEARAYFQQSGLTYADVTVEALDYLKLLLDEQIILERKKRAQSQGKPQYWVRVNEDDCKYGHTQEGKLVCAFMTGRGEYFADREVISFNRDGFIGFCGSADKENTQPILRAFVEWCFWLQGRKRSTP
jgi:hypothetical protein